MMASWHWLDFENKLYFFLLKNMREENKYWLEGFQKSIVPYYEMLFGLSNSHQYFFSLA